MKKKQILKSLIMILTIVFSVLSSLIVDSKLTITAHAASNYGLTIKWTEGIEWVATDEAGTNRWTNGSIKYFAENTSAGTYIKLKPGYRLDCLAADSEWADWTTISDTLYYDSWSMYGNRTVTVKVISEVFEENGERYTYNGNYKESGYKLVEVDSWNCTHSFEGDDIIGYIESDPSDIYEGYRLNPTNPELLASLKTYTSDSRYKIRVGSPYVKYTGEVSDVKLNELVSKYTLYVDTHNVSNETGFYPEYGADKDNDWLLASNYRCPDKDAGADADYAGFAYYRRYYAYCKDTLSWYIVGSAHNWLGCANGDIGANEFHTKEYTHTIHKYKLVESHEYTVRLNTGNIPSSELTKLTETASTEGWTWNENGRYFSKAFVQNENNYLPGVNKFFSTNNYESVGSKVTDKYFVQDKTKNPTKVLYNWWTSASGGTDIGRGKKTYNNLYEISKDNSGIVNLYPHWMGYTTVFNYTDNAPANTAGLTVTINNSINDGMDNYLYQVYGSCFFYKGTDGTYHDYEGTNPDLKVTASIPDSNGYKYIFVGWHHKNWNYLTDGLGKLTYKNNYNIGQGKTSYSLSPHFSRVGINYNVRLNANVPDTESTLQVLHQNGISSYIYNSTSRYFSRELTYDDSQDMLSPDVYSLKGYHLISRSNWYTEKTGGNTVSAQCNNTEAEYPDWTEKNWNLTTTDGATVDLYARWQANNYKIAYNLDGGTYGKSHPTSADYDTIVTIDNPSKSGYIFAGWTITGYDSTTSGHNAATWSGEKGTSYKNLTATDGATVTFTATWEKEAPKTANLQTTGDVGIKATSHPDKTIVNIASNVQVSAVLNTGYVFKGWYNGNVKVSDDLSFIYTMPNKDTVLTAKTTPINYTISYNLNGGAVVVSNPTSYNIETPTFALHNPTKLGYVFVGWTGSNGTIPQKAVSIYKGSTGNKSYKANWTAADIGYTVNHYVMDINGNYPSTPTKTERLSGFTDTSVTAKRLNLGNGFTYPDVQTVKVKADGTTVVNYYYIRNKYTLDLNGLISSVLRPNLTEEVDSQTFIAGKATVTVNGKVLATNETDFCQMVYYGSSYKITTVPEAGYSIIGNTTIEGTMPASDKTVTITINANKDTKYIVRHWKEKLYLDGTKTYADSSKHNTTNYFLADTDNLTGQTNRLVTPTVKTYEGFTSPSAITVRVKGDGSLIVDYYYTRNTYTLKTDDSDSNKDDQDNGIKSGNGIDSSKTNVISEGNNKKDNKKKFKYEEVVTVTTDTLSGYHWHVNDDCETIKRNLYPTGWSDHEGYRVEKWYTENGKTYGYKDQTTKFYMPAHDVKLDVNATNNSYKIIFEKNKPINVTNPYTGAVSSASNEITGTVTDTFYIYNHANQKLPGNVYNLTGWTFKGWSLKKDYSNGYSFGWEYGTNSWNNDLSHLTTKNLDVIHMYAKWEANRYQITFNYEHNSSNPYGNLGYDEKAEAATKLTKNGADSKTATYDAKVGSLPNPTLTGATFVKWVDSKGNEYTEDTIYKITSPITLYAVWQQNTGTFAYIANGITYNNNGIGVYEAINSNGTNQFKAMTEDITLEENKFGTTMENTSYSNFTKKSKYGYVVINAGTSYAKETDTSGDSVYYSFQGWSANNYATVAGDKNAGLIHQVGYKDRLFNYAYETMANEMNTLETGYNSKDTSVADSIRAKANELYNTKELTQNNTYAIMYAVWDQFPVIKSDQVVLTINDFSAYVNENADGFEQHAYDVIKDRIVPVHCNGEKLAFDHAEIILEGLLRLKNKVLYSDIAFNLLPEVFTMPDIKQVYEVILGKQLYKANFKAHIEEKLNALDYKISSSTKNGKFSQAYSYKGEK